MKGYMTTKDAAEKWGLSIRAVSQYCTLGKIPEAERAGRVWLIPEEMERPVDSRVKSGEYKGWRKIYGKGEKA